MELDVYVEGRHGCSKPLRNKNVVVSLSCSKDDVTIRHDDGANPEFWLQTSISREQLLKILEQMQKSEN